MPPPAPVSPPNASEVAADVPDWPNTPGGDLPVLVLTRDTDTAREVAVLAAEGLTNAKIAERLVMSRETVKTHLTRIFAKLGVSFPTAVRSTEQKRAKGAPTKKISPILGDVGEVRFP